MYSPGQRFNRLIIRDRCNTGSTFWMQTSFVGKAFTKYKRRVDFRFGRMAEIRQGIESKEVAQAEIFDIVELSIQAFIILFLYFDWSSPSFQEKFPLHMTPFSKAFDKGSVELWSAFVLKGFVDPNPFFEISFRIVMFPSPVT
eukprot:Gb_31808 [translate_table: standard]